MKKYFIVTDVHGFYDEMMKALNKAGYDKDNPDHIFVSLGDLMDRGRQPYECLEFVNSIPKERKILVCGNHENLMEEARYRHCFFWYDNHNGSIQTVIDLYRHEFPTVTDEDMSHISDEFLLGWLSDYQPYREYMRSLVLYGQVGNNIFVHGWIPVGCDDVKDLDDCHWSDWNDAVWFNGMKEWHNGRLLLNGDELCTVFCGHWHVSWFRKMITHETEHQTPSDKELAMMTEEEKAHYFRPVIEKGIVALDACTVISHIVNCYVLEE